MRHLDNPDGWLEGNLLQLIKDPFLRLGLTSGWGYSVRGRSKNGNFEAIHIVLDAAPFVGYGG